MFLSFSQFGRNCETRKHRKASEFMNVQSCGDLKSTIIRSLSQSEIGIKKKISLILKSQSNRVLEVDSPQMAGYQTATQFGEYSNSSFLFFSFCSDGPVRHIRTAQQPVQPNCLATSSTRSTQRHPEEEENCSEKNEVLIDGRKCPFDFYAK